MARVRFQLNEHIPRAVAQALRRRGIDVTTTVEAELLGAPDTEQLRRAHAEGRMMVTHDRDYLALHQQGRSHAGIAYCDQGSRSIGEIVGTLTLIYETYAAEEVAGRVELL